MTGAREGIGSNLRGVPRDRNIGVDVLASFLVKSLVKQKIEFYVRPRFPQGLDRFEDLEIDANMLFGALGEKDCRPHVGSNNSRQ